jgi:hypothetical protein
MMFLRRIIKTSRRVIFSWSFLLNLLFILLITCWITLLSQTIEMRDPDGNVLQQGIRTYRVWESWWTVVRFGPGWQSHLYAVAIHFGVSFFITYVVWLLRLLSFGKTPHDENTGDNGIAPSENNREQ